MLTIPENIKRRLHELRNARQRKLAAEEYRMEIKYREDHELGRLRVERFEESAICAQHISDWLREFFADEDCLELLRLCRVAQIFSANFRDGRPARGSSTDCTTVELRYNQRMMRVYLYRLEWHKGERVEDDCLGHLPAIPPTHLAVVFHPDFLKQWAAEIRSGKIWDNIERSLR